ncbi:pentatricopeptide repeat-containing protein At3g14580, mitochondrial-like [Nicotiana sylvestris]|uniref:pentatricopeptide repeat-containing protein At3g14580, mitochondrial-like n=1 Tax=Nicotiana sylvestris TaxID=4096 RepID=UPI00388CAA58
MSRSSMIFSFFVPFSSFTLKTKTRTIIFYTPVNFLFLPSLPFVYMRASELGVEIDACCLNIIIKGLSRCGELDAAYKVFDEYPKQNCHPNVRTFSTIKHALCERGCVNEALGLLERMEKEDVEPDAIVFNTLISGLRKQGRADEGIEMFKKVMLKGCDPNPGTYQEVLYASLDAKRYLEAKDFMAVMIDKRVNPSFESYKLIIHGLCDGKLLGDLDWVLRQMVRHGFVPRMGMWRQILGCLFPDGDCCTVYSYEEILAD